MNFETLAIRIQTERSQHREHSVPLFNTSSFVFHDAEQMEALFAGEESGNIYSRFSNPNVREFEEKIRILEGCEDAHASASGMAAIFAGFMAFLKAGDHLIASRALFGSTVGIIEQILPEYGISSTFIDPEDCSSWESAVRPESKMLFLETPTNPGLIVIDLEKAGAFTQKHKLIFHVDNCFATPYLQNPAKYGADIISHSATKFIDGQGRVLGGVVTGKTELIEELRKFCRKAGPAMAPFNAWILSKSLETLHVRMDRHCENALTLAQRLSEHPEIQQVNYPFLPNHPQYGIAIKQMRLGGGVLTFVLKGGRERAQHFLNCLNMISLSANLGDSRTIATHPTTSTHSKMTEAARLEAGIVPGLIRVSVGLEHIDDIFEDVAQALARSVVKQVLYK
ncbi:MAG: PLP-dependent transferase [Bacteroidota bacterium]